MLHLFSPWYAWNILQIHCISNQLSILQQVGKYDNKLIDMAQGFWKNSMAFRLSHTFLFVKYNKMPFAFLLLLLCTACVMFDEKALILIKHESHIVVILFWITKQLPLTHPQRITLIQGYYNVCYLRKTLRNKYN